MYKVNIEITNSTNESIINYSGLFKEEEAYAFLDMIQHKSDYVIEEITNNNNLKEETNG